MMNYSCSHTLRRELSFGNTHILSHEAVQESWASRGQKPPKRLSFRQQKCQISCLVQPATSYNLPIVHPLHHHLLLRLTRRRGPLSPPTLLVHHSVRRGGSAGSLGHFHLRGSDLALRWGRSTCSLLDQIFLGLSTPQRKRTRTSLHTLSSLDLSMDIGWRRGGSSLSRPLLLLCFLTVVVRAVDFNC